MAERKRLRQARAEVKHKQAMLRAEEALKASKERETQLAARAETTQKLRRQQVEELESRRKLSEARRKLSQSARELRKERLRPYAEAAKSVGRAASTTARTMARIGRSAKWNEAQSMMYETETTLGPGWYVLSGQPRGYDPAWTALESAFGLGAFTQDQALMVLRRSGFDALAAKRRLGSLLAVRLVALQVRPVSTDIFGTAI